MEEPLALLKAKLSEVVRNNDEAALALVTTLLTLGGRAYGHGYIEGFSDYRRLWGDLRFDDVRKWLQEEGLIREDERGIYLNHPIYLQQESSYDEQERVSRDVAAWLFEEARDFYTKVIAPIGAILHGRYVLSELLKSGQDRLGDEVYSLARVVGQMYFDEVRNILARAGLFVYARSGKRNDWFGLFPPLIDVPPIARDALTFVYVAQYVRPDGPGRAGVLDLDCEQYEQATRHLALQMAVREVRWLSLKGCATTPEGSVRASAIVQERLKDSERRLRQLLDELPGVFLCFMHREILKPEQIGDAWIISPSDAQEFRDNPLGREQGSHLCLLNDSRIKELRDRVMETLVQAGLAAKAHTYVGSTIGRVGDLAYVPAPEVGVFFEEYMERRGLPTSGALFDGDLELKHRLYHVLTGPGSGSLLMAGDKQRVVACAEDLGIGRDELERAVGALVAKGLVQNENDRWLVPRPDAYQRVVAEDFYGLLVAHVLGQVSSGQPPVSAPTGPPPRAEPPQEARQEPEETPAEAPSARTRVRLGQTSHGESYYWEPLAEPNPHLLVVGAPGMGKTQTAKSAVFQLRASGVPALIVDFENEYRDTGLASLKLEPGQDVTVNPLDLLEGGPRTVKFRVSGILQKIYGLGAQQEALVRRAVKKAYESAGIVENDRTSWTHPIPPFERVKDALEAFGRGKGQDANRARATLNRLEPLFDLEVFSGQTQIAFAAILRQGAVVLLRDLPTDETRLAAAEFLLRWLWQRILQADEAREMLRLAVILDEAHKLAYEHSPVDDFLRRGRKYGVSCLLATQQPDDFESREMAFQNSAVHIVLGCNAERHARTMAREMLGGEALYHVIRSLEPFQAVVWSQRTGSTERVDIDPYYRLT
ncbi:MAG: type IV secretion system DNA-binding domain-containing protein [Chloroflexi bacterium]|nr:type IV secretion system DNA-binding domain-containing protein [Chloroflexota bacterium]